VAAFWTWRIAGEVEGTRDCNKEATWEDRKEVARAKNLHRTQPYHKLSEISIFGPITSLFKEFHSNTGIHGGEHNRTSLVGIDSCPSIN